MVRFLCDNFPEFKPWKHSQIETYNEETFIRTSLMVPDLCANTECYNYFKPKSYRTASTQLYCNARCRERCWVAENRDSNNKRVRRYRKQRYAEDKFWRESGPKAKALKVWYNEIKSNPCTDCTQCFEPCSMDFDHREGEVKLYNVGTMVAHHYAKELIDAEVAKCDLVCSNCHRVRTRKRRLGSGTGGSV